MNTNTTPLFTPDEIVQKTQEHLSCQIKDKERELLMLEGQLIALKTTLRNVGYWVDAGKDAA